MASAIKGKRAPDRVQINYQLMRNITSPDEKFVDVQSFIANIPAAEILKLNTRENLRSYLAEYNPRKRNRVHDAIRETLLNTPERFIIRNSGFVVTCSDVEVDDGKKNVTLYDASIINGAQSQGEIRAFLEELNETAGDDPSFFVRLLIISDSDRDEVVETAIARNIVTPVKSISEAGARNQLDELEKSIQSVMKGAKIRKSESQSGEEYLDTRFVLQLSRLLMPTSVSGNGAAAEKLRAYKNPEQCLTDFCDWEAHKSSDASKKAKYDFTVQMAPFAFREYKHWEAHDGWNGHQIWEETKKGGRAVRRNGNGRIMWVSPGLLFPLMGAMSEFCSENGEGWKLKKPSRFRETEMIQRTVNQFRAHNSDPMMMGRSEAAYDALRIYPQTLVEVLREFSGK